MDPRLIFLLAFFGSFGAMTALYRRKAREYGYTEYNQQGRQFVRGQRANAEAMKQVERTMIQQGHDVREDGWTAESRKQIRQHGYQPGTYIKFLTDTYSDVRGRVGSLPDTAIVWLRVWCCENPTCSIPDVRTAIMMYQGVLISRTTVRRYLKLAGITRQKLRRIAAQRFTQANIKYAHDFQLRVRGYNNICWFDESGVNQKNMTGRDNKGMGICGAGGAYIRETLRYPAQNISVLALIDQQGLFCAESHEGGTDTVRVDEYFKRNAIAMSARGIDCVILDNCPAHRIASITYWLGLVGISVDFLPRYWPQWNPIEVRFFILFVFNVSYYILLFNFLLTSNILFFLFFFVLCTFFSFGF